MPKDFCDSCTEEKEVSQYRIGQVWFYWCDECKEQDDA
jgi:hypothetical protein